MEPMVTPPIAPMPALMAKAMMIMSVVEMPHRLAAAGPRGGGRHLLADQGLVVEQVEGEQHGGGDADHPQGLRRDGDLAHPMDSSPVNGGIARP